MTPKFIISFLVISILATQCVSKEEHTDKTSLLDLQFGKTNIPLKTFDKPTIYGTWTYSFPFYSSELTVNENGTFIFHEQGCMGHGYTEGTWTSSGDTYILTSLAKYKQQQEVKVETIVQPIKTKKREIKANANDSTGFFIMLPEYTQSDISYNVSFSDTSNIYYDKVLFRFLNNALYRLDSVGISQEAKFVSTKNMQ